MRRDYPPSDPPISGIDRYDNSARLDQLPDLGIDTSEIVADLDAERSGR